MRWLDCEYNQLTTLDVSNNTALRELYCRNNQLTALDVSNNTALQRLDCDFPIDSDDVNYTFDLPAFMNAYTLPRSGMSYIDFRFTYVDGNGGGSLTVDSSSMNNAVKFPVSDGAALSYIDFTITFSDGPNIRVYVYPASGSTPIPGTSLRSPLITTTNLPDGALDTPYSADLTAIGATPITWTISDGSLPDGLTLDESTGKISGTISATGIFTFTVQASNSGGTDSRPFTILVPFGEARAPKITTENLTEGFTNSPYGFKLTATGTAPLTWSLAEGSLPDGFTLSPNGYITGSTDIAESYSFTVQVSNDIGTDTAAFTLSISESPLRTRPAVMTEDPAPAKKDEPYICQLMSLGTPPFKWTVKGKLPSGLTMNDAGLITGTPTKAATKKLTFTVSNDYGEETRTLTLKVWLAPEITTRTLKDAIVAKKYNVALKGKGTTPRVWEIEGRLPQGITLFNADNAKIIGVPVSTDKGMIRLILSNAVGEDSKVFTLNVGALKPVLKPSKLANGTYGKNYKATIKATKGTTPITLRLSADLPAGLSFDSETGILGGTPQAVCKNLPVTVIAVNMWGVVSKDYKLTIKAVNPKITTKKLADAATGKEYSADLEATGTPPITWSATGLPAGLSIDASGRISGTPTAYGKFNVKVKAANAGKTASKSLKLNVLSAPVFREEALKDGKEGSKYTATITADGTATITYSVSAGTLPGGLTLNPKGKLSGTPTAAGTFTFTVKAENSVDSTEKDFTLTIAAKASNSGSLPENAGTYYNSDDEESDLPDGAETLTRDAPAIDDGASSTAVEGYIVVAVLPEVSADVSGMYDFAVTLSDDAGAGEELVYLAGSSEPSDDDNIAEFYDEDGAETSTVPENRKVTVSVWLKQGVTYKPAIAVKR